MPSVSAISFFLSILEERRAVSMSGNVFQLPQSSNISKLTRLGKRSKSWVKKLRAEGDAQVKGVYQTQMGKNQQDNIIDHVGIVKCQFFIFFLLNIAIAFLGNSLLFRRFWHNGG
ncbi:hypothetical protein TYRP_005499 [Tyrophagus putrescentiae]|nr:hypothetical protein TYRP_005499 [Tyrophagus putrescentiae]